MRNLMLGTAMVLPLMMAPAMAQDTTTTPAPAEAPAPAETPAPAVPATGAATAPMATEPVPAPEADAAEAEQAAAAAEVAASGKVEQEQAANELRIDWITDTTVNAPDGTAIGDINDVIIDGDAGTVKAAVIGVGGFLGIGEKQIAVPWAQLTINYDAQEITSDLTREEAEAAPEYVFRDQEAAPAADGAMAPAAGTMPPADGAVAPADGTMAPADGAMTPAGSTAPMPAEGAATPAPAN